MQRMHKNCTLKTLKLRDHRIEDCIALHILSSPTISGSMQDLRGKQKDRKIEISFLRVVLKRGEARLPFSSCLDAEVDCHEESYR